MIRTQLETTTVTGPGPGWNGKKEIRMDSVTWTGHTYTNRQSVVKGNALYKKLPLALNQPVK